MPAQRFIHCWLHLTHGLVPLIQKAVHLPRLLLLFALPLQRFFLFLLLLWPLLMSLQVHIVAAVSWAQVAFAAE